MRNQLLEELNPVRYQHIPVDDKVFEDYHKDFQKRLEVYIQRDKIRRAKTAEKSSQIAVG